MEATWIYNCRTSISIFIIISNIMLVYLKFILLLTIEYHNVTHTDVQLIHSHIIYQTIINYNE